MQISQTHKLADGRGHYSIGRIRGTAEWRGANAPGGQADRFTAVRGLIREAQEYGAERRVLGLKFHIDDVKRADIEGPSALLVQKRVVRSAVDSYGRIYFRATGISPHSCESTSRGVKELAIIDTSLSHCKE